MHWSFSSCLPFPFPICFRVFLFSLSHHLAPYTINAPLTRLRRIFKISFCHSAIQFTIAVEAKYVRLSVSWITKNQEKAGEEGSNNRPMKSVWRSRIRTTALLDSFSWTWRRPFYSIKACAQNGKASAQTALSVEFRCFCTFTLLRFILFHHPGYVSTIPCSKGTW